MAGLYKTAFANPGMDEEKTNAHWKREQDNYLSQIGAMELIKRDPMASLGYKIRSANENKTLDMGSNIDENQYYGLYQFHPYKSDSVEPRYDGTLDVSVTLQPQHYGATVAHELGHVGSRNMQSDPEVTADPQAEEKRQRLVDYINNPKGSQMHQDAVWFLVNHFGLDSYDKIEAAADKLRVQMGLKKPDKKTKKKQKPATTEWDAADWSPEEGTD